MGPHRSASDSAHHTDVEQQLRLAGLRVTKPRLAVLDVLRGHPHSDTATILEAVRTDLPTVSHQAIYDVLGVLTDAGMVRRIQPAGSLARYEIRRGDNHHHIVCRTCGSVADVPCATGSAPCLDASDDHGFTIDEAEVIYWGQCPRCATTTEPPTENPPSQPVTKGNAV